MKAQRGSRGIAPLCVISALDGGGWLTPRPGRFTPEMTCNPLYRRLDWPQGRFGRVLANIDPSGFRSPYHPARSESLYRLSYSGAHNVDVSLLVAQ